MKVQLESTTKIVTLEMNGSALPARIWEGATESGIKVHAYITRIAIDEKEPRSEEFKTELRECRKPSVGIEAIPLRLIL